jgi:segregation and condensation protein A
MNDQFHITGDFTQEDDPTTPFIVDLDGFEGPLDLLLTLAREQKVDLKEISIVQLADQYLSFIASSRDASLDLAAEYLVMAAWLAYLKSRLLCPEPVGEGEPTAEEMADALAFQMRRLEAFRRAAGILMRRPQLGDAFHLCLHPPTDAPAEFVIQPSLFDLLQAYAAHLKRQQGHQPLEIRTSSMMTVEAALKRLRETLVATPSWAALVRFLPEGTLERLRDGDLDARGNLAATFAASLEMVREGEAKMRQNKPFGPIYLRAADAADNKS